eukprot:1160741-Pelagomonas_calceolata.AAC.5
MEWKRVPKFTEFDEASMLMTTDIGKLRKERVYFFPFKEKGTLGRESLQTIQRQEGISAY